MTRLSALDAAFLEFETECTPAHVGSVAFFEGEPFRDAEGRFRLAEVRSRIRSRLHLVPRLRQVVLSTPLGVAHPTLDDDRYFDIVHHVKLIEVGAPADERAVFDLAAALHMERLDRSRPLWELWFVDGLADGRVALIEKIHHAIVDGVSGVEIATVLLDLDREAVDDDAPAWYPHAWDPPAERLANGVVDRVRKPVEVVVDAMAVLRHPRQNASRILDDLRSLVSTAQSLTRAPECSLNVEVGNHRRLSAVRRDLEVVRKQAHDHDGTVNDLVLSVVAGGLRELLLARGERIDDDTEPLRALVPVSLHESTGEIGNLVASLMVDIPVGIADADERLDAVAAAMKVRKASGEAAASGRLLRAADFLPPILSGVLSRSVHRQPFVNLVITNVPGPDVPLFAMGGEMLDAIPIVPLTANLTLGVGVLSYNGHLALGLYADPDACGDFDVFVAGVDRAFSELGCPTLAESA